MEPIRNRDGPFQWDPSVGIPPFQLPVATKHRHHTTRDQRRDIIKMAHHCRLTEHEIVRQMQSNSYNVTARQIRYALQYPDTPKSASAVLKPLNAIKEKSLLNSFALLSKVGE
jgi:hypothetical protein